MITSPILALPEKMSPYRALELVYRKEIDTVTRHVKQGRSIVIRTHKHVYQPLRDVLIRQFRQDSIPYEVVDGSAPDENQMLAASRQQAMVQQFQGVTRSLDRDTVFIFPYLDVLTSGRAGVTQETRELLTLIHENPYITLLAFEDPSLPLPEIVMQAFFSAVEMIGTSRNDLASIVTQSEALRFGTKELPVRDLSRFLSGKSPIEIRRLMAYFGELTPLAPDDVGTYQQRIATLRELTVSGDTGLSTVNLFDDIAGYESVKQTIHQEILSLLAAAQSSEDEKKVDEIESLLPRGLILHGPPGTGKTLFARGIAEAIQGTVHVVNGPELKSKYVGESEANIRNLFARARANAPAVLVFDELDSIAGKRNADAAGQEASARSIVNQLLTEMDGFRREELVFVIGTTNLPDLLDPALLRPGRFGLFVEVGYPDKKDRRAIIDLYDRTLNTNLNETTIEELVEWTGRNTDRATPHSGDDIRAVMVALRRRMLREELSALSLDDFRTWLMSTVQQTRSTGDGERTPSLEDVAGYDEVKQTIVRTIIEPVRRVATAAEVEERASLERRVPRGLMLWGPPGTGKTLIARAVAKSAGYREFFLTGPELKSQYYGQSEARLRELFHRAKANAPAAVIIDEIDTVAGERSASSEPGDGSDANDSLLTQFLSIITTLEPHDRVLVIGTTNRPDRIDSALLRPGRIGTHVLVDYPDATDRDAIIRFYLAETEKETREDIVKELLNLTGGHTKLGRPWAADDIRSLVMELSGTEGIREEIQRRYANERIAAPDLFRVAVHEIGHVVAAFLDGAGHTVSGVRLATYMTGGGGTLGAAEFSPGVTPYETEATIRREIRSLLAATIAEQEILGDRSTGCESDLQKATGLARDLVTRYGMGGHGTLRSFFDTSFGVSPGDAGIVGSYIDVILKEEEDRVRPSIMTHKQAIRNIASVLVEELSLDGPRVTRLIEEQGIGVSAST
jgi:SpoVK/Ycf46/Vps4 family AAA+-type ATPase